MFLSFCGLPAELQVEVFLNLVETQVGTQKLITLLQSRLISHALKGSIDSDIRFWKPYLTQHTLQSVKDNRISYPQGLAQHAKRLQSFSGNSENAIVFCMEVLALKDLQEANMIIHHAFFKKILLDERFFKYIEKAALQYEVIAFLTVQDPLFREALLTYKNKGPFLRDLVQKHSAIELFIKEADPELQASVSTIVSTNVT